MDKALNLVESKRIKLHRFLPSGREIWTAVGREGDQLIDINQPYCSCKDFHFRLLANKKKECYHLQAFKIAKEIELYDLIVFNDSEYYYFIKGLMSELLS